MVAQGRRKTQAASRARIKRDALIRRSPILSIGSKTLWAELSRGWCWTEDQVCFPHQRVLAHALGAGERSVKRWIKELTAHGLLTKRRTSKGNVYSLVSEVPEAVCDPRRLNNKWLAEQVRHLLGDDAGTWDDTTPDNPEANLALGDARSAQDEGPDRHPPGANLAPDSKTQGPIWPVPGANLARADEAVKRKQFKEEEEQLKGSRDAKRNTTASRSASDPEHSLRVKETQVASDQVCSLGVVSSDPGDSMEDLDDLIQEDDAPRRKKATRRARRGKRAPSLVDLPGSGLRTASKSPSGPGSVEAGPPPPEKSEDVLELLRGEIEEKFGSEAARGLAGELTTKEKGQIRNTVLRKYEPGIVLAMIRVLVWDWEIARKTIFPFRPDRPIPLAENLVQYAKDLAAAASTGLTYSGDKRGAVNTYADVYLEKKGIVEDDNPF